MEWGAFSTNVDEKLENVKTDRIFAINNATIDNSLVYTRDPSYFIKDIDSSEILLYSTKVWLLQRRIKYRPNFNSIHEFSFSYPRIPYSIIFQTVRTV